MPKERNLSTQNPFKKMKKLPMKYLLLFPKMFLMEIRPLRILRLDARCMYKVAFFMCMLPCVVSSQSQNLDLKLTSPLVVSPQAAALAKYGDIPVSMNSGVPEIGIPIYNISVGNLKVPVTLSYHSGGIKVEDIASSAGLGWSTIAGGSIVRQVRGMPDESTNGYYNNSTRVNLLINGPLSYTGRQTILQNLRTGQMDGEPDIFLYNLPDGGSGKFFMDTSGRYVTYPRSNLLIEGSINSGWKITTDNGSRYFFNTSEFTSSTTTVSSGVVFNDGSEFHGVTAWYVDKITDVVGNEIDFSYSNCFTGYTTKSSETEQILLSSAFVAGSGVPTEKSSISNTNTGIGCVHLNRVDWRNGSVRFSYNNTQRQDLTGDTALSTIGIFNKAGQNIKTFRLYTSYFGVSGQPFYADATLFSRLKLDSVQETGSDGGTLPPYKFEYSQITLPDRLSNSQDIWGYYNGKSNARFVSYYRTDLYGHQINLGADRSVDTNYTPAGMLYKITYPAGGYTQFDFENNVYHSQRDAALSYSNTPLAAIGGDNSSSDPDQYFFQFTQPFIIPASPLLADNTAPVSYQFTGGCPSDNNSPCLVYVYIIRPDGTDIANFRDGDTLHLPPGNYTFAATLETEFPHSPYASFNASLYLGTMNPAGLYDGYAGGLRIKRITNYDGIKISGIKEYNYNYFGQTNSSGSIGYNNTLPAYNQVQTYHNITQIDQGDGGTIGVFHDDVYNTFSTASNYQLLTSGGGYVTYSNVQITEKDVLGNTNGKSEYYYTSFDDKKDEINTAFPYPPACSYEWKRGLELMARHYLLKPDNSYALLREKKNNYAFLENGGDTTRRVINGVKAAQLEFFDQSVASVETMNASLILGTYHTAAEYYYLAGDTTTLYNADGSGAGITTVNTYNYRVSPLLMSSQQSLDSKGGMINTVYRHVADYSGITGSDNISLGLGNLQTLYAISPTIEKSIYKSDMNGANSRLVSSILAEYKPNLPFLDKIDAMEMNIPLTGFTPSSVSGGSFSKDNRYLQRLSFNRYDGYGNILEEQKTNDVKEVYLYGYNSQFPVAKVTQSDYPTVSAYINQSTLDNPPSDAALRTELDKIRTGLAGTKALVTTYTYSPLIGKTSETDASGHTIYYEYDGQNRLKTVKDQDGRVLKTFDYQYQQ